MGVCVLTWWPHLHTASGEKERLLELKGSDLRVADYMEKPCLPRENPS
jgi:hypothetical protein